MEQHAISPEQLYYLLGSHQDVALFDVRQPLDLLAYSEIIPGARRIPPAEVLAAPSLIPKDREAIVYCTCPRDKTSLAVLRRALELQFFKIKFLKGSLEAWKAKGCPVELRPGGLSSLYTQPCSALSCAVGGFWDSPRRY
jgi:rhodanese-related sulfurtransferase